MDLPPERMSLETLERSIQEVIARRWDLYEHSLQRVANASSSGAATPFHEQADAALHDINRILLQHRRLTQYVRLGSVRQGQTRIA